MFDGGPFGAPSGGEASVRRPAVGVGRHYARGVDHARAPAAGAGQPASYVLFRVALAAAPVMGGVVFSTTMVRGRRETAWVDFATSHAGSAALASAFYRDRCEGREASSDFAESDLVDYVRRDNPWLRREPIKPGPFSTWLIIGCALFRVRELPVTTADPLATLILARLVEHETIAPADRSDAGQ